MQLQLSRPLRWTIGALCAAAFIGLYSVYSYNMNQRVPQAAQQVVSGEPVEEADYRYVLRTQKGKLAVYMKGEEEPAMEFDIAVRTLPEVDQRQLEQGIYVQDYSSLVSLIEDYIS